MRPLFFAFSFALVILSIGCSRQDETNRNVLKIGNGAEPLSLDPQVVTGMTEYNILQALFEGLVTLDSDTLEVKPGVAEKWEISDDGLTYTFHFNPDAKWSNGDPVTADDFTYSWQRILNPKFSAEYAVILFYIQNAEAYNKGEIDDFSQVGIKAPDSSTLRITLKNPTPFFMTLLVHFAYYPVHPPTIEKFNALLRQDTPWTHAGNMVSNGPFALNDWKLGNHVSVVPNPYYWALDAIGLDEIKFYSINDANTEERVFRYDKIDTTSQIPVTQIQSMLKNEAPQLRLDPELGTYFYIFNVEKPPLDQKEVRQALSLAINRETIARDIRQRGELAAYHITPPGTLNYNIAPLFKDNAKKARALLEKAGFPNGKGFPELRILYNRSDMHKEIAEAIQSMWQNELGINVSLINQTWGVYLQSRKNGEYDICRAGWFADYNDPMTFLDYWLSNSGVNHTRWGHPEYDKLIAEANEETDINKRINILNRAEALLIEEAPVMPIHFYKRAYLLNPKVSHWPGNIMNIRDYRKIRI